MMGGKIVNKKIISCILLAIVNLISIILFIGSIFYSDNLEMNVVFWTLITMIIAYSIAYLVLEIKNKDKIATIFMQSAFYTFLLLFTGPFVGFISLWFLIVVVIMAVVIPLISYLQYRTTNKNKIFTRKIFLPLVFINLIAIFVFGILCKPTFDILYAFINRTDMPAFVNGSSFPVIDIYLTLTGVSLAIILCSIAYLIYVIAKNKRQTPI